MVSLSNDPVVQVRKTASELILANEDETKGVQMALEAGRANDRCRRAKAALEEATKIVDEGEIELHELADTLYDAHMAIETQKHKVSFVSYLCAHCIHVLLSVALDAHCVHVA